jgi:hypothetical protein
LSFLHPQSLGLSRRHFYFAQRRHYHFAATGQIHGCQGKVEMSPSWQSRNVVFCLGLCGVRVILRLPVKRRRALVATNPIKE